uniref:BAR domain-containing protein n=1 Tax=Rhabditophanes sp. KR3021 TaxID=114890 RepID=A0AC35TNT0_9BILA
MFANHLKKKTLRTKEKLLGGLGKSKATTDEEFDRNVVNVTKQAKAAEKLYRDIKNYSIALKACQHAESQLRDSIKDMYEEGWPNANHFIAAIQGIQCAEEEYEKKLNEEIIKSAHDYRGQFSDLQKKIDKRGRKLVDFDGARREYENLKASGKKTDEDPKMVKAKDELEKAEEKYHDINNELNELLPVMYDSRITFFVDTLQTLFNTQATKDLEASKQKKSIVVELDKLGMDLDNLRVQRADSPTESNESAVGLSKENSFVEIAPMKDDNLNEEELTIQVKPNEYIKPAESPSPIASPKSIVSPKSIASPPKSEPPRTMLSPADKPIPEKRHSITPPAKPKRQKDPLNPFDESDDEC